MEVKISAGVMDLNIASFIGYIKGETTPEQCCVGDALGVEGTRLTIGFGVMVNAADTADVIGVVQNVRTRGLSALPVDALRVMQRDFRF